MKEKIVRYYSQIFGNPWYLNRRLRTRHIKKEIRMISGKRLLDLGCGDGYFSALLSNRNEVIGIDMEDRRDKAYSGFEFSTADARRLPFQDASFDYVFCSDVIEHIPNYEQALHEIERVLKPGGTCLISTVRGHWNSPIKVRSLLRDLPLWIRKPVMGQFDRSDRELDEEYMGHVNLDLTPKKLMRLFSKMTLLKSKDYCGPVGSFLNEIYFGLRLYGRFAIWPIVKHLIALDDYVSGDSWQFLIVAQKEPSDGDAPV